MCLVLVWLGTAENTTGFRGFLWAGWWVGKRWLSFISRAVLSLGRGHNLPKRWLSFRSKSCAFIRSRPHYLPNTVVSDVSWFLTPTRKLPEVGILKKKFQGTRTEMISILKNVRFTGANAKPWPWAFLGLPWSFNGLPPVFLWKTSFLPSEALFSAIPRLSLAGCTSFNPFLGRAPKILLGFPLPLPASWLYGCGQKPVKKKIRP